MKVLTWIVALAVAYVALTFAVNYPTTRRLRTLAKTRHSAPAYAAFRDACSGIPEADLERIYRLIQGLVPVKNFPVRPDDDLINTLAIDDGDLADFLEQHLPHGGAPETAASLANQVWQSAGKLAKTNV